DGVSPRAVGLDRDQRDDLLFMPYGLIDANFASSRQQLLLHAGWRGLYYDTYRNFDTRIDDYRGAWHWGTAGGVDGELSAGREETVTGFEDYVATERNVLALRSAEARVNWRPRPDRRISVYVDEYRGTNSEAARRGNDYRIEVGRLEFGAATAQGNEVVLGARYTDGNYPNRS